jgi:hypothetical protein
LNERSVKHWIGNDSLQTKVTLDFPRSYQACIPLSGFSFLTSMAY